MATTRPRSCRSARSEGILAPVHVDGLLLKEELLKELEDEDEEGLQEEDGKDNWAPVPRIDGGGARGSAAATVGGTLPRTLLMYA